MLQPKRDGECVAVGNNRADEGGGVDVALNKVAAKARVSVHGALAVDPIADLELAEVGLLERLRSDADLEVAAVVGLVRIEFGDGETGAVDAMLSPIWQSFRIVAVLPMVIEYPPPPDLVASCGEMSMMGARSSTAEV